MTSLSPRPGTERPRVEVVIESVVAKRLGALPVAAEFLCRLDVAGIVDGLRPPALRAGLTHGRVVEVLVANRADRSRAAVPRRALGVLV